MKKTLLFAIDVNAQETIVSESEKGSKKISFLKRIPRKENELLFDSVVLLTTITRSPGFDQSIFNAMDKVCQMIYENQRIGK